jgi:hypothetical protein
MSSEPSVYQGKPIHRLIAALHDIFLTPLGSRQQKLIVLMVALAFLWMPQHAPVDWDLNTTGFWTNFPNTYISQPNFVYPPWGLLLMLPYRLMQAEGARVVSVIVIGWLAFQQKWSLAHFFAIVLSPYFLVTMSKSNMDILALVLPILLWRGADRSRWQSLGWGLALSMMLLKPQGTMLVCIYFLWNARKRYKELLAPIAIVALVIVPISLVGSPPLALQWLHNVTHPSAQNTFYWSINNISLTRIYSFAGAAAILALAGLILFLFHRYNRLIWTENHTLTSLFITSMFLSPYTSQQSLSAALAFVPSWAALGIQSIGLIWLIVFSNSFYDSIPLAVLGFTFFSLVLYRFPITKGASITGRITQ